WLRARKAGALVDHRPMHRLDRDARHRLCSSLTVWLMALYARSFQACPCRLAKLRHLRDDRPEGVVVGWASPGVAPASRRAVAAGPSHLTPGERRELKGGAPR